MNRSALRLFLLPSLLVATSALADVAAPTTAAPVQRARDFMKRVESMRTQDPDGSGRSAKSLAPADRAAIEKEMLEIAAGLEQYATTNPTDIEAVEYLMAFYWIKSGQDAMLRTLGGGLDLRSETRAYGTILDRALAVDSLNASLHFWRGWLYASSLDSLGEEHPHLQDAIRETRRAVALAPGEPRYRESLASMLVANGDDAEALELYRGVRADHPMYLRLHDFVRIPPIEGLERVQVKGLPPMMTSLAVIGHMFRFRGTAAEFVKRARKHWPKFRPVTHYSSEGVSYAGCHLIWRGDQLEVNAATKERPEFGVGGVWIEVVEFRLPEGDPARKQMGLGPDERVCMVSFISLRPLEREK